MLARFAPLVYLVAFGMPGGDDDRFVAYAQDGAGRQILDEPIEVGAKLVGGADEVVIFGLEEPQRARGGIRCLEVDTCGEDSGPGLVAESENDLLVSDHTVHVELGLGIRSRSAPTLFDRINH